MNNLKWFMETFKIKRKNLNWAELLKIIISGHWEMTKGSNDLRAIYLWNCEFIHKTSDFMATVLDIFPFLNLRWHNSVAVSIGVCRLNSQQVAKELEISGRNFGSEEDVESLEK